MPSPAHMWPMSMSTTLLWAIGAVGVFTLAAAAGAYAFADEMPAWMQMNGGGMHGGHMSSDDMAAMHAQHDAHHASMHDNGTTSDHGHGGHHGG